MLMSSGHFPLLMSHGEASGHALEFQLLYLKHIKFMKLQAY